MKSNPETTKSNPNPRLNHNSNLENLSYQLDKLFMLYAKIHDMKSTGTAAPIANRMGKNKPTLGSESANGNIKPK